MRHSLSGRTGQLDLVDAGELTRFGLAKHDGGLQNFSGLQHCFTHFRKPLNTPLLCLVYARFATYTELAQRPAQSRLVFVRCDAKAFLTVAGEEVVTRARWRSLASSSAIRRP